MATHSSILAWRIPWTEEPRQATVHGVAKSRTRLSNFTFSVPWRLSQALAASVNIPLSPVINAWAPSLHQVSCNRCFMAAPENRSKALRWEEGDLVTAKPSLATGAQYIPDEWLLD